jgi:hypothetical protein
LADFPIRDKDGGENDVTDRESGANHCGTSVVTDVTDRDPDSGRGGGAGGGAEGEREVLDL